MITKGLRSRLTFGAAIGLYVLGLAQLQSSRATTESPWPQRECKPDAKTGNRCLFGAKDACPGNPGATDFYCDNAHLPGWCDSNPTQTCYFHQNDPCGGKFYCLDQTPVRDGNGIPIICIGEVDWCTPQSLGGSGE